jgi:hypothetical protein
MSDENESPELKMSADDLRNTMFQIMSACNEMEEYKERPIELKESKNGDLNRGLGLFATRDIGEGEWITTFPVHWIVLTEGEKREFGCSRKCYGEETDFEEMIKSGALNKLADYSMGILEDMTIIGDPLFKNDNRLYGCFINDLSFIPYKEYDESKRNVGFKVLDVHATRQISKGEELSLCYGPDYWEDVREETSRRQDIENRIKSPE